MQSSRKNIIKIVCFILLLQTPFWITRLMLLFTVGELVVNNILNYLITSVRFDLKAMVIWYSPLFIFLGIGLFMKRKWWDSISRFLLLSLFLGALVFGLVNVFYYPTSKSISGVEIFQLIKGQSLNIILGYLKDYWFAIILALLILYVVFRIDKRLDLDIKRKGAIVLCSLSLIILGLLARGSFALKPLNLLDAYSSLDAKEAVTAVTPIYVLIESIGKSEIQYQEFVTEDQILNELKNDELKYSIPYDNKPNVCLIILESFGKEYTGINDAGRPSYTPFLDSLMQVSVNYTNAYANGLRSMDAVASIMTGVPALMKQPFIGSLYTQSIIESIPEKLKVIGYHSSFFHAADELSMGFKPYLLANGLDKYYARQQYPNSKDFDGTWGIFDRPFLKYFENKLTTQPEPWFSTVFTISSHHPYKVPEQYGYLKKGTAEIHQSVQYTDLALRSFFNSAQHQPWFDNTIFIITADHTSINQTPEHRSYRGKYGIPLMIYAPMLVEPDVVSKAVQHLDIFPTIKQIAGVEEQVAMGRSLLDSSSSAIVQFDGSIYNYTNDSFTLQWNGSNNYRLFDYRTDKIEHLDLAEERREIGDEMLTDLKIALQKYNYRMLNNKFK